MQINPILFRRGTRMKFIIRFEEIKRPKVLEIYTFLLIPHDCVIITKENAIESHCLIFFVENMRWIPNSRPHYTFSARCEVTGSDPHIQPCALGINGSSLRIEKVLPRNF